MHTKKKFIHSYNFVLVDFVLLDYDNIFAYIVLDEFVSISLERYDSNHSTSSFG